MCVGSIEQQAARITLGVSEGTPIITLIARFGNHVKGLRRFLGGAKRARKGKHKAEKVKCPLFWRRVLCNVHHPVKEINVPQEPQGPPSTLVEERAPRDEAGKARTQQEES